MKKMILAVVLAIVSLPALAGTASYNSKYTGSVTGWTKSESVGGSAASSQAIDNGASLNAAGSLTNGSAQATGSVSPTSATSNSGFTSLSVTGAGAWKTGNATGEASAGGGTDVKAGSTSKFGTTATGFTKFGK